MKRFLVVLGVSVAGAQLGCGNDEAADADAALTELLADGDLGAMAADAAPRPAPPPPRFCPNNDCAGAPLAYWKLDDCNALSTQLADSGSTSFISHPAFRAVSAACVAGVDGQAVALAREDDIVYAPDQPDFSFAGGLTIAAWIKPDKVTGTQSIVRKRLDGTSSFLLAIDDRKLTFALRLTNGRNVALSASIPAGKFSHVAATYDGQFAILYVGGVQAAKVKTPGTISPGAGPILIGNDANGRQLKGVVDEIWLNTLAAPAGVIKGLTCVRAAPIVTLSPATTPPQIAGATVSFDVAIKNPSSASCPVDTFDVFPSPSFPLATDAISTRAIAGPGQTTHATIAIRSLRSAPTGSYPFQVFVANEANLGLQATTGASYVVGTGSVACDGVPPFTPSIIGTPLSPSSTGAPFSFAAPGLVAPTVTPVMSPDGSAQALQVTANPGTPTDPANAFLGFGVGFGNPSCVDAGAYTGVRFTITGDLGTCAPTFSVIVSQDNAVAFGTAGTCTANTCVSPFSGPITTGTNVVRFADMAGGRPLATVDATALNGVSWNLTAPSDGVTAPCVASFTISDVSFVTGAGAHAVAYTFDTGTQGWRFSDFNGAPLTNLAVVVPPGSAPPALAFDAAGGDPVPGALKVTARFTAFDQYVDPIVGFPPPGLDLAGKTLRARVKRVSGAFAGAVQFHASSGPSFVYAGSFHDASNFPLGTWVEVALDLGAVTEPGFDASQIIQIGAQIFSGFSDGGGTFTPAGDTVFEIDTVTD